MAVQAQYGCGFGGVVPSSACAAFAAADEVEMQMRALQEYGALLSAAAAAAGAGNNNNNNNNGDGFDRCAAAVVSGAQSELTCNNGGGGVVMPASRKRGREMVVEQYVPSSSAALLPFPGMAKAAVPAPACRMVESALTSTSGRSAAAAMSVGDTLVAEMYQHNVEIDALVRMECERMRAGLEQARKRQCQSLVRAATLAVARRLREKEAELEASRRRAAELEERLRQAAVESQAWCGLARSNEAVAAGLRATLDTILLRAAVPPPAEGFGESDPSPLADDAQSWCFQPKNDSTADATSPASKWACKSCGEREATVLLLPCRHLCLCKACEPKLDACPVCLAAKNASVHIAIN